MRNGMTYRGARRNSARRVTAEQLKELRKVTGLSRRELDHVRERAIRKARENGML